MFFLFPVAVSDAISQEMLLEALQQEDEFIKQELAAQNFTMEQVWQ